MCQPVGVDAASVRVCLDGDNHCWSLPLDGMEAVARFSPIQAALSWLKIFVIPSESSQHCPPELHVDLSLSTGMLGLRFQLQSSTKSILLRLLKLKWTGSVI